MSQLQAGFLGFSYWRSDSAARTLAADQVPLWAVLNGVDLAYFLKTTLVILPLAHRTSLLTVLRRFRSGDGIVVFGPNLRPIFSTWPDEITHVVMQAAVVSDIALPPYDDEADWFCDDSLEVTLSRYAAAECCISDNRSGPFLVYDNCQRTL